MITLLAHLVVFARRHGRRALFVALCALVFGLGLAGFHVASWAVVGLYWLFTFRGASREKGAAK
jgi:hypothetical protein